MRPLLEQTVHQRLDLGINQRFAAADGNHRRVAFRRGGQAISSGIMSLREVEYSRIRPQPVQVKLQVCSGSSCSTMANFSHASNLLANDVSGDLRREGERKSHAPGLEATRASLSMFLEKSNTLCEMRTRHVDFLQDPRNIYITADQLLNTSNFLRVARQSFDIPR